MNFPGGGRSNDFRRWYETRGSLRKFCRSLQVGSGLGGSRNKLKAAFPSGEREGKIVP